MKKQTQNDKVLADLQEFGSVTPKEEYERHGIMRLAARIQELRVHHNIKTTYEKHQDGVHARYHYEGEQETGVGRGRNHFLGLSVRRVYAGN